jgi:hypothetical protein
MTIRRAIVSATLFSACLVGFASRAGAQLQITIQSNKADYVVNEPVRLTVWYQNAGDSAINVMPARELGINMVCTFYKVTEPGGATVRRKNQFAYPNQLINPEYQGDLLRPSEYFEVSMYPSLTRSMPGETHQRRGFTFGEAGSYRLRLGYMPPPVEGRLWRPVDGGPALSNEIVINVRPPSVAEKAILDTYWSADRADLAMEDGPAYLNLDEQRTRRTLAAYSQHPLADFLRLNLACGLMKPGNHVDDEVIALLEELRPRKEFRWDEVHMLLAASYSIRGDDKRAMEVCYEAIQYSPQLLHNYLFMTRVILAVSRDPQKIIEWDRECARGERMLFAGVPIPSQLREVPAGHGR